MGVLVVTGETDWKVLAIDVEDPLAEKLNGECTVLCIIHHVNCLLHDSSGTRKELLIV